jgi:hypothetical protein
LPFFSVVRRIGDHKSSCIIRYRLSVLSVCGGSTIGGKVGGKTKGVGSGKGINSFLGRSRVLGAIAGRIGTVFSSMGAYNVGSIRICTSQIAFKSGGMLEIYHWLNPCWWLRCWGFSVPAATPGPCVYGIYLERPRYSLTDVVGSTVHHTVHGSLPHQPGYAET